MPSPILETLKKRNPDAYIKLMVNRGVQSQMKKHLALHKESEILAGVLEKLTEGRTLTNQETVTGVKAFMAILVLLTE